MTTTTSKQRHSTAPLELTYNPAAVRTGEGIYDINDMRDRCRIDSETGCWHWGMSVCRSRGGNVPRVYVPAGVFGGDMKKSMSGGRVAWLMAGKKLKSGWVVWRACGHEDCINPGHLKAGTKADEGAWMAEHAGRKGDPRRAAVNRNNVSSQALSRETVSEIEALLEAGTKHIDISSRLAVSKSTISKIANARHYHQRTAGLVRGASIFTLGALAHGARV